MTKRIKENILISILLIILSVYFYISYNYYDHNLLKETQKNEINGWIIQYALVNDSDQNIETYCHVYQINFKYPITVKISD